MNINVCLNSRGPRVNESGPKRPTETCMAGKCHEEKKILTYYSIVPYVIDKIMQITTSEYVYIAIL